MKATSNAPLELQAKRKDRLKKSSPAPTVSSERLLDARIAKLGEEISVLRKHRASLKKEAARLLRPVTPLGKLLMNSMCVSREQIVKLKDAGWTDERIRKRYNMAGTTKIKSAWKQELWRRSPKGKALLAKWKREASNMKSKIVHRINLIEGGATSPTVELYQRASGLCKLWWYAFGQEGGTAENIASFREKNWKKAIERAGQALKKWRR